MCTHLLIALLLVYVVTAAYVLDDLIPIEDAQPQPFKVDPSSMAGLVLCGYQGWFRTPSDDDNVGWQHWSRRWGYAIDTS